MDAGSATVQPLQGPASLGRYFSRYCFIFFFSDEGCVCVCVSVFGSALLAVMASGCLARAPLRQGQLWGCSVEHSHTINAGSLS